MTPFLKVSAHRSPLGRSPRKSKPVEFILPRADHLAVQSTRRVSPSGHRQQPRDKEKTNRFPQKHGQWSDSNIQAFCTRVKPASPNR